MNTDLSQFAFATLRCTILKILYIFPLSLCSQLSTDVPISYAELLQTHFSIEGVTISNVQYTGYENGIGSFEVNGTQSFGISRGILLTSGSVIANDPLADPFGNGKSGPHGPNLLEGCTVEAFELGDPDLELIGGSISNDAAVLEFDFVSSYPELKFNYVFGSEEYPEFAFGLSNDAFGLFLSGPDLVGTYVNDAINVALLPTEEAISINTINLDTNSVYYIDNEFGINELLEYDGYTVPLTAQFKVTPGLTYHLKMAISDINDYLYDSGVFIGQLIKPVLHTIVPNIITANGDGVNDLFIIRNLDLVQANELTVLNRWGLVVYQQKDYQNDWSGMDLSEGTYTYVLRGSNIDPIHGYVVVMH